MNMEKEFQFVDFLKRYLFWILIIPILLISLLSGIVKLGTIYINTNELIIDINSPIKLGEYLYYYFSIVGIEVTGLLSYAIWKTSIKSNKLSEAIINKEVDRDKENIRESALIAYYDLLSNIGILKILYSTRILKTKTDEINKLNITTDWVKNIANLRDILTGKELEMIFYLYNSFLLLNELNHSTDGGNDELNILINKLSKMIFIPVLLDYLWMDFNGLTVAILNNKYFPILRKIQIASKKSFDLSEEYISDGKIRKLIIKQSNGSVKYEGEFLDEILVNGTDKWNLDNGQLLYSFTYKNGTIIRGKYNNKFKEEFGPIFNCKFNKYIQTDGYTSVFHSSNIISYRGSIISGEPDGQGVKYSTKNSLTPIFSGVWRKGRMINGEFINKSSGSRVIYFKGEYRNNNPYSGEIECSELFEFKGAYGFKGIIREGKLLTGSGYKFFKDIDD